ncbi:MAG: hypothetical protein H6823_23985 [Planctomycetaceae bacterium]|nr:hypothetical protein [Planctomycetaceae bacterium]
MSRIDDLVSSAKTTATTDGLTSLIDQYHITTNEEDPVEFSLILTFNGGGGFADYINVDEGTTVTP